MSNVQRERNTLLKRFKRQAVVKVTDDEDNLYTAESLRPTVENKRLLPVKQEAIDRLNSTMKGHVDGNAQIYYTMLFKDQPRGPLIKKFYNGMIKTKEFKKLPLFFQRLEREQLSKLGPTSRFTIEKLYDGFVNHIDAEAKTINQHLREYEEAVPYFIEYLVHMAKQARKQNPKLWKKLATNFTEAKKAYDNLNKDKSGGDPYFIRVDRKLAGIPANDLYLQDARKVQNNPDKEVYFEMFRRVQAGGNTFAPSEIGQPITATDAELTENSIWKAEKNRVVQGDSRAIQFLMKNISDIFTKLMKEVDPNFVGWMNQEEKNEIIYNFMKENSGKTLFDSFDATDYDASTDPKNFEKGIHVMYEVCRQLGLDPDALYPEDACIRHYLYDATLTPWGAFERAGSTPSGSNFTGPNGTIVNMLRCYVQTARLYKLTYAQLNQKLYYDAKRKVPNWMCVGDDAVSKRALGTQLEQIAEENDSDGFKQGSILKLLLDAENIHFLQCGYRYEIISGKYFGGYYPATRFMEHSLFQEEANQYNSYEVSAQAVDQNLFNLRYNPLQEYCTRFMMEGDPKYRLGSKMGVMKLFKLAANGRTVAQFLGREWDPQYQGMTWQEFGKLFQPTARLIEQVGRKYYQ